MTFLMVFQSGSTYELLVATATFVWFLFSMHSLVRSPTSRCLQNLAAIAAFVMFSWRIIIVLWLLARACFLIYQRHVQNAFKVQRWSPSRKEKFTSGQLLKSCACLNRNNVLIMGGIPGEPMSGNKVECVLHSHFYRCIYNSFFCSTYFHYSVDMQV